MLAQKLLEQVISIARNPDITSLKHSGSSSLNQPEITQLFRKLASDLEQILQMVVITRKNMNGRQYQVILDDDSVVMLTKSPESYQKKYSSPYLITFPNSDIVLLYPFGLYQNAESSILNEFCRMTKTILQNNPSLKITVELFSALLGLAHHRVPLTLSSLQKQIIAYFGFLELLQDSLHAFDYEKIVQKLKIKRDESVIRRRTWALLNDNVVTLTFRVNLARLGFDTYYHVIDSEDNAKFLFLKDLARDFYPLSSLLAKEETDYGARIHSIIHVPYHWRLNNKLSQDVAYLIDSFYFSIDLFRHFNLRTHVNQRVRKLIIKGIKELQVEHLLDNDGDGESFSINARSLASLEPS